MGEKTSIEIDRQEVEELSTLIENWAIAHGLTVKQALVYTQLALAIHVYNLQQTKRGVVI